MLSLQNISYYIGNRVLYEDVSFSVYPGDSIGVVGRNGTGKSTLFRLIVGQYTPNSGRIERDKTCKIGFLDQDLLPYKSDNSIRDVAMEAFEEAMQVQKQMQDVLQKLEHENSKSKLDTLADLQERFETLEGYALQAKTEEVLEGLGFTTEQLEQPLSSFSGGWRMRVMLAKILLQAPSLLILDEPTNHLDLPAIHWLENYLQKHPSAKLVISHDRTFLDKISRGIFEVEGERVHIYKGNYSSYIKEKELRRAVQENAFKNQQQKIKQTEQFINRFRAKSTKARQVQSKVKMLDKMDMVYEPNHTEQAIKFHFDIENKSGKVMMQLQNVGKTYGDNEVIKNTYLEIERGDKIALVGANGKGKSTLLRMIQNEIPFSGKRMLGHNVRLSFYAQHQIEALDLKNNLIEELGRANSEYSETQLRTILGGFLFHDEDIYKKISVLSGGERARVSLAKTLIAKANLLLLDEPSNHLDTYSVAGLASALKSYEGAFILVSHDRFFIREVANKIWYIKDKEIKYYPGTFQEYEQDVLNKEAEVKEKTETPKKAKPKLKNNVQIERKVKKTEKKIETCEQKMSELEEEMSKPSVYSNQDQLLELSLAYQKLEKEKKGLDNEWEELVEQM